MQVREPHDLAGRDLRVDEAVVAVGHDAGDDAVLAALLDLERGLIGLVAPQDVQDEPLLDRLPHRIDVERHRLPVVVLAAEEHLRLGFRRGREGQQRQVPSTRSRSSLRGDLRLARSVGLDQLVHDVLGVELLVGGDLAALGEDLLQISGGLARLRSVRLVDDHGEGLVAQRGLQHALDVGERLDRDHDDQRRARQRVQQRARLRAAGAPHGG